MPEAMQDHAIQALLVEYAATSEDYIHNDNFPWQIGGVLIAGTFVFWGMVISAPQPLPVLVGIGSLLVALLLSAWILYAHHYAQIYLWQLQRMREIEHKLGMNSHRRWVGEDGARPTYSYIGPSSGLIRNAVYVVASLGGPVIAMNHLGWNPWLAPSFVIVLLVVTFVHLTDRQLRHRIKERDATKPWNS